MAQGIAVQVADVAKSGAAVAHADDFLELDRRLVLATQGGLPLVPRPYAAVADEIGVDEAVLRQHSTLLRQPAADAAPP